MAERSAHVRLLPWSGPEGKRAHLITDGTASMLSLLADKIESQQIESATVIVELARPMVAAEAKLTADELRWICSRLMPARVSRLAASQLGRSDGEWSRHPVDEGSYVN